ncbi:MAG: DUF2867 domain-containing protein [Gemmatimonadota bacterium]|nr:DUF2867 domain-containing protein [Gemmatimonadota bacterium]
MTDLNSKKLLVDSRTLTVPVGASEAFRAITSIGGDNGWYAWNWLWKLRGLLDVLVGGVGMRRSAAREAPLEIGDEVDFWRVVQLEPDRRLRLKAEMILPGEAWLEFEIGGGAPATTITQTATFAPKGLLGRLYWYSVLPLHELVFRGMLHGIARAAQKPYRSQP